jgi:hypothetical protein
MQKNFNFIAYTPRKESSWTFYIAGKAKTISEITGEILDITKKILSINEGFFYPTKLEYSLITQSENTPVGNFFKTRINPLARFPREIKSDNGISFQELKNDIQSIETPKDVIRLIRRITIDGKTRFVLDGRDEYIDHNSKGLYVHFSHREIFPDDQISIDPLRIVIYHTSLKDESTSVKIDDPAYYEITFWTYTDMWFEKSSIGLANRNRLRKVLKGVYDSFDVSGTLFMSDGISEKELKEVIFGQD